MTRTAPRILVAPLDWGLGHAARCVVFIRELIAAGAQVFIGASGGALALLTEEFPDLPAIRLPPYNITYSKSGNHLAVLAGQMPHIIRTIAAEHRLVNQFIRAGRLDGVVSDSRFGLWSRRAPSIYITSQLFIPVPPALSGLRPTITRLHHTVIRRYHQCWIPDIEGEMSLTGELNSGGRHPPNVRYVGLVSRLDPPDEAAVKPLALLALLSGPEPQRTLLEESLKRQLHRIDGEILIVRGKPVEAGGIRTTGRIRWANHLTAAELTPYLAGAEVVVARPGYSTPADCCKLGKRAVFIPTPGQYEQEYLARRFAERGWAHIEEQDTLDLPRAIRQARATGGFPPSGFSEAVLRQTIRRFLQTTL